MNLLVAAIISLVVLVAMIVINFSTYNGTKNTSRASLFTNSSHPNEKNS